MSDRFAREKEQILSQYIIHHDVSEEQVGVLADRLDQTLAVAERLHTGQRRKTGEDYIFHPVRTTLEVSRYGRIVDWASIEASLLHDTLEDTEYTYPELESEFPDAAGLVEALTKIKDSRELSYQKLFRYVLQDIRVLLVKIADRLDNLESLAVFPRHKQERIAKESALMYANICRRLCMLDVAERLTEKIGQFLHPEALEKFQLAQSLTREEMDKPLTWLRAQLAKHFPGDLNARIDIKWHRFNPDLQPRPENLYAVRIITGTREDAYRALGRIHMNYRALPGAFTDTISTPRDNGFRALETAISERGRIIRFYITSRSADRFNRLGLLSMDIDSPQFNLRYLDDLREFLQSDEGNFQDFLRFQRPDAIQVISPKGDVFSLEQGTTALDFAFAVHDDLGLRATGAQINDDPAHLSTQLHAGDRVVIETADEPVSDERYLDWATSRKALVALRRHLRKLEGQRAATTGQQWLLTAAQQAGMEIEQAEQLALGKAAERGESLDRLYQNLCLGTVEINEVLGESAGGPVHPVSALMRKLRPARLGMQRQVRRYDFDDLHIRFCPVCSPVIGDEIEGTTETGRLVAHRRGCATILPNTDKVPLTWEHDRRADMRDPGPVEMEILLTPLPGVFYAVVAPFRNLGLDIQTLSMPGEDNLLTLHFSPSNARTLDRLIRSLRKFDFVRTIRVRRNMRGPAEGDNGSAKPHDDST